MLPLAVVTSVRAAETLHTAIGRCATGPGAAAATDACLAAIEASALKESGGRVQRDGPMLSLQTSGGPVRFDDRRLVVNTTPQGGPTHRHRYLGTLENSDARLVLALAPGAPLAAARYWLVGAAGGPVLALDDLPWPAPDGRLLAVVRAAETGRHPALLALYVRVGTRWTQQYRYEAQPGVSYRFKSWRNDGAAVRLEWDIAGAARACEGEAASGTIQLRDGPYGWDLVPPLPRACGLIDRQ